jgi:type IV secretion system protein VirB10
MWSRLIFPDGSSLVLDNLKGADQSGYSGFKGAVIAIPVKKLQI